MLDKHTVWCEQAGALVVIDIYMLPWPRLSSRSLRHHAAQLVCHRKVTRLVAVTAQLRMLKLDVHHMHKLGQTSCHAVKFIPSL